MFSSKIRLLSIASGCTEAQVIDMAISAGNLFYCIEFIVIAFIVLIHLKPFLSHLPWQNRKVEGSSRTLTNMTAKKETENTNQQSNWSHQLSNHWIKDEQTSKADNISIKSWVEVFTLLMLLKLPTWLGERSEEQTVGIYGWSSCPCQWLSLLSSHLSLC